MNARTLSLSLLLLLTACRDGIPPSALVEPIPALELCDFDTGAPLVNLKAAQLEAGHLVDGGFVPLAEGDEVEMAPRQREGGPQWFTLLALRITAAEPLPATVCALLDGARPFTSDPLADEIPNGFVFHRASDGALLNASVPLSLGRRLVGGQGFNPLSREPVDLGLLAGTAEGGGLFLDLEGPALTVKPVNRVGFLSDVGGGTDAGAPVVDAGPPPVPLSLQLQATTTALRPGEAANVELTLSGGRGGQQVDLFVSGLPSGVVLTLERSSIAGGASDAEAALTTGRLLVDATAAPGAFTLQVAAVGGTGSAQATLELQVLPAPTVPSLGLSVSPLALRLAPGDEAEVKARVVPFAGLSGRFALKARASPGLDVTISPAFIDLQTATDVTVRVKLARSEFAGETLSVQLDGVLGRQRWPVSQPISVTTLAVTRASVFVRSRLRERRFVSSSAPTDWDLDFGTMVEPGATAPLTSLLPVTAPAGCSSAPRPTGLRFTCDASFRGAADVQLGASSTAGTASTSVRLVGAGSATVLPELQPGLWDARRPRVAFAPDGTLTVAQLSGLGARYGVLAPDGGVAYQPVFAQQLELLPTSSGVQRLWQSGNGTLDLSGKGAVRSGSLGPIAGAVDTDGTAWVATGVSGASGVRLGVSSCAGGQSTWVLAEQGLPLSGAPTDLALSARSGSVFLAAVELAGSALGPEVGTVTVRRWASGQWTALPQVPAGAVVPLTLEAQGRRPERVLGLTQDAALRPVLAFIGVDEALHVLRLEGASWVALGGASVTPGLLPFSLSLSSDAAGRVLLAWHEATHVLIASSGEWVLPRAVERSTLHWATLDTAGFVKLDPVGLDLAQGTFEDPFATFDPAGRPVITWVEDGRVVVQRAP